MVKIVAFNFIVISEGDFKAVKHHDFKVRYRHFGLATLVIQPPLAEAKVDFDCSVTQVIVIAVIVIVVTVVAAAEIFLI